MKPRLYEVYISRLLALFLVLSLSAVAPVANSDAAIQAQPGQGLGIASVPNLRDMGGYQTRDGKTVASGLVYRSNQLSGISESDMKAMAALNLKVDFDLRTAEEREKRPDELPPGVEYVWLDVLADSPQAGLRSWKSSCRTQRRQMPPLAGVR